MTGTDYLSPEERAWYLGQSTNIGSDAQQFLDSQNGQPTATAGASSGSSPVATIATTDPLEQQRQAAQAGIDARGGVATAQQAQINANSGVTTAQQNQLPYKQAVYDATGKQIVAQGSVLDAQAAALGPKAAQIGAQGQVIDAQGAQTTAQRAAIQQNQQADTQRLAEQQSIQAAAKNTADQVAVARAQNERNNEAYKYTAAGLAQPIEVNTANGADQAGLAPGTVAKLQTQEQLKTTEASNAEKLRSIQLDQAQQIVNLAATDTAAAQQAAARVGLTVDQANLLVEQAQNGAARAGLDVSTASNNANQAGLAVDAANIAASRAGNDVQQANLAVYNAATAEQQAKVPPAGVPAGYQIVTDPFTGASQYMSAADAAIKQEADKKKLNAALNGETPLAAFSDSQLVSIYAQGVGTGIAQDMFEEGKVSEELQRRGYTQPQAHALLLQAQIAATSQTAPSAIDQAIAGALAGAGLSGQ